MCLQRKCGCACDAASSGSGTLEWPQTAGFKSPTRQHVRTSTIHSARHRHVAALADKRPVLPRLSRVRPSWPLRTCFTTKIKATALRNICQLDFKGPAHANTATGEGVGCAFPRADQNSPITTAVPAASTRPLQSQEFALQTTHPISTNVNTALITNNFIWMSL